MVGHLLPKRTLNSPYLSFVGTVVPIVTVSGPVPSARGKFNGGSRKIKKAPRETATYR
jgi:hypothetical protein